jgi:hypothetical protein
MKIFGKDVTAEIECDGIKQVQIHGKIRKFDGRNFINGPMLQIQFGDIEMMCERISVNWWNISENTNRNHD